MPPPLRCPSILSSTSTCAKQLSKSSQSRTFSSTSRQEQRVTRARRQLFRWLQSQGEAFKNPLPGSTNYMTAYTNDGRLKRLVEAKSKSQKDPNAEQGRDGDANSNNNVDIPPETLRDLRPFPLNNMFQSQPVLSDELREKIWEKVMREGESVRDVSSQLLVEMNRVGAVVRLMEIEKEWKRIGKPLARPYAEAVMSMLPKTPYEPDNRKLKPHESINDLPIHSATGPQIFHPTSESRVFTRADAAKVFDEQLLPADDRVPHPELALKHKDFRAGFNREEIQVRQQERDDIAEKKRQLKLDRVARKLAEIKVVDGPRWEFRFENISVDAAGKTGRGHNGVGWRYGVPLMDRSRGQVKIPTKVA